MPHNLKISLHIICCTGTILSMLHRCSLNADEINGDKCISEHSVRTQIFTRRTRKEIILENILGSIALQLVLNLMVMGRSPSLAKIFKCITPDRRMLSVTALLVGLLEIRTNIFEVKGVGWVSHLETGVALNSTELIILQTSWDFNICHHPCQGHAVGR